MVEVKILSKETIGPAQVRDILEDIEQSIKKSSKDKKQKSLEGIPQRVKDSMVKFSKLNKEKETKLIKDLQGLNIPRLTESHIIQIVTIMPKDVDELITVFTGSKTTITQEDLGKIQSAIKNNEK